MTCGFFPLVDDVDQKIYDRILWTFCNDTCVINAADGYVFQIQVTRVVFCVAEPRSHVGHGNMIQICVRLAQQPLSANFPKLAES